jgi:uncharacterized membrane protein
MDRRRKITVVALIALLATLSLGSTILHSAAPSVAKTSASYKLTWHVVGGGGGVVSSASYRASTTMGQALSGKSPPSSTNYRVEGGYEGGGGFTTRYYIYLPQVLRNAP